MDLSALIFVALAVAWAVYLIPKALKHHEIDRVSRSVESFSDRVRVLARREPVSAGQAALVVSSSGTTVAVAVDPVAEPSVGERDEIAAPAPTTAPQVRAHKAAAARAAQRRRRVLGTTLLANLGVVGLAAAGVIGWAWEAIPATLLVAWLVACRLMVRKERAVRVAGTTPVRKRRTTLADQVIADEDASDDTGEIAVVADAPAVPGGWDPVPVTLPTYVDKATAGRTVRTIDLDSTGVWSSGRNAVDSALAREADQQKAEQAEQSGPEERRVSGA
ncbi:divisome protein SepX/GlpR [Nocardioides bizhenqiangii]|uniref:Uncharacterized protein n=1 Tax=Nocardioides bizhenqiangii TaxID=3095076 RepID=A0ABZ0ZTL8_9ACTN|nr:hypothetical protein [Nocardioides sp. HM61]WQQ27149.1 hypothetical protein SHK19_02730 [Nocardioides sp. HM61]